MLDAAAPRPRRADATRNNDRLIAAARLCFRVEGPDVSLQTIAKEARLGVATLFRNFADKDEMILAVLEEEINLRVNPLIRRALTDENPLRGMAYVINAMMAVASREANMMAAVRARRQIMAGIATPVLGSLFELLKRAQAAGQVRAEIGMGDLVVILAMVLSAVESTPSKSKSWRRFGHILADGMLTPSAHRALPEAPELNWFPEVDA